MQAQLDARTGVAGRMLAKRDEPLLWMEIYEEVEDGPRFEEALAAAVTEHRLDAGLQPGSARRTECFVMG
jgi:hypothetical protein